MSLKESLRLNKLTTVIISFLGVVGAIITIYAFFFQEKETALSYEVIANTNVLDIHAEVSKLDILYDHTSLKQSNQNLRIITVRVVNSGTENILNSYYDDNAPVGMEVSVGRIVEAPEILASSNNYLKSNLHVSMDSRDVIKFSKIIFEPREYFILKFLVVHPSNTSPEVRAIGKIAGIKEITVVNAWENKSSRPFLKEVFAGNVLVQTTRSLVYGIFLVLISLVIVIIDINLPNYRRKMHRRRLIQDFKKNKDYFYNKMDNTIFDRFENEGPDIIELMSRLLKDDKKLGEKYKRSIEKQNRIKKDTPDYISLYDEDLFYYGTRREREWAVIKKMIKDGIVIKDKDTIVINQPMKSTLDKLVVFLKEKGTIKDAMPTINVS